MNIVTWFIIGLAVWSAIGSVWLAVLALALAFGK